MVRTSTFSVVAIYFLSSQMKLFLAIVGLLKNVKFDFVDFNRRVAYQFVEIRENACCLQSSCGFLADKLFHLSDLTRVLSPPPFVSII